MCTVCGCGQGTVEGAGNSSGHHHHHGHGHHHHHGHHHGHDHDHHHHDHAHGKEALDYGVGLGGVHVPGMSESRIVEVERNILEENDRFAAMNRDYLTSRNVLALNLVSSPGSGKTTLLVRSITDLQDRYAISVIEGDQQTSFDAERIRETAAPAVQINTGKGCHLDGHMVGHALERLAPQPGSVLFIENVGNLVCPAAFDLGEAHKVVMLSVTEGDDKPLKYPDMFHAADLMVLTKIDLLPHVSFDVERCVDFARRINNGLEVLEVSATTGAGLNDWYAWIEARRWALASPAETIAATARI